MWSYNAPEDPLFVLFHSFIDYIRFMRQDCWNYDKISVNELDEYIPYSYDNYITFRETDNGEIIDRPTQKYYLNTPMIFGYISDYEWSYSYNHILTPRNLYDISFLNVSYELGSFWSQNIELQEWCLNNLNETWFYNEENYDYDKYKQQIINNIDSLNKNKLLNSIFFIIIYITLGMLCILILSWIIKKQLNKYNNNKNELNDRIIIQRLTNYGSV